MVLIARIDEFKQHFRVLVGQGDLKLQGSGRGVGMSYVDLRRFTPDSIMSHQLPNSCCALWFDALESSHHSITTRDAK